MHRVLPLDRYISPPIPWRHTHLLGQIVEAVNRSAFVAAGNDQSALDARHRLLYHLNQGRLPFSDDGRDVDPPLANQLIDQPAFANCANDDYMGT